MQFAGAGACSKVLGERFALRLLRRLETFGVFCLVVPYLSDLLQATLGRQTPRGSIAFVVNTNVFYHHLFHPGMKAEIEIA